MAPVFTDWPDAGTKGKDRLEWNIASLVGAYDRVGAKGARWDGKVREALRLYSELRSGKDATNAAPMAALLKEAIDAGCSDSFVGYLSLRFVHGPAVETDTRGADAYRAAGDAVGRSEYPPIRKFYAMLRAAQAWKAAHGRNAESAQIYVPLRREAFGRLVEVLKESDLPAAEGVEAIDEFVTEIRSSSTQEDEFFPTLMHCLGRRWPDDATALWVRGRCQVALAWNRRGSGYADSVTEEGWKGFEQHLAGASKDLERAWRLDPQNHRIAVEMMQVELGQSRGRARIQLWFNRAMQADPACHDAAHRMAWHLQPKWHGSVEEAIAFGRQCVTNRAWKGRVPLVLWEVHQMLANDRASGLKDEHWVQSGVWDDVRASFERFFELNPEETGWYHDYAMHAYKCRQFGAFLDLVPKLGSVNESYFGGREGFARKIAEAEKATGRKASLPIASPGDPPAKK